MSERGTQGRQQESPLKTERGNTSISNAVVSQVAGMAAQEIKGVQMGRRERLRCRWGYLERGGWLRSHPRRHCGGW